GATSLAPGTAPSGRRAAVPVAAAPGPAPPRRLGQVRIFATTLADGEARTLLPDGAWDPAVKTADEAAVPVAHVWRTAAGDVFLPFSPDAALINLCSEAYQAGRRAAG